MSFSGVFYSTRRPPANSKKPTSARFSHQTLTEVLQGGKVTGGKKSRSCTKCSSSPDMNIFCLTIPTVNKHESMIKKSHPHSLAALQPDRRQKKRAADDELQKPTLMHRETVSKTNESRYGSATVAQAASQASLESTRANHDICVPEDGGRRGMGRPFGEPSSAMSTRQAHGTGEVGFNVLLSVFRCLSESGVAATSRWFPNAARPPWWTFSALAWHVIVGWQVPHWWGRVVFVETGWACYFGCWTAAIRSKFRVLVASWYFAAVLRILGFISRLKSCGDLLLVSLSMPSLVMQSIRNQEFRPAAETWKAPALES
ncbi:hypothetical protein B0T21DRAFT_94120 [Apiosordaria backusii]|uniref:Uncharacterized protein n=1 Tax=Apiosordaria backusii TaxID=314023 RepID=A0AA40K3S3_9PEZI|nr:hypothetical protein B0T21DRAFT_94120 [Apiosordaria backusii]